MRTRAFLFGAIALTLLIGLWLAPLGRDSGQALFSASTAGPPEPSPPVSSPAPSSAVPDLPDKNRQADRAEMAPPAMHGRVEDDSGRGIPNAELTWSALETEHLEWEPAWHHDDWGPMALSELTAVTNDAGAFVFETSPVITPDVGSILWARCVGYEAECALIEPGHSANTVTVTLARGAPTEVVVLDSDDRPVEGALVQQFGLTPARASVEAPAALDSRRARRYSLAEARTNSNGMCEMPAFPGEQVLRASHGGLHTKPWRGIPTQRITLRLHAGFSVSGTVSFPDWSHLNYEGERRITIEHLEGSIPYSLASLRFIEEGAWGPITLPLIEGGLYRARLSGSPIIPVTHEFPSPGTPGGKVYVDFAAELGHDIWFVALDEAGQIIPDAEAAVRWAVDGRHETVRRRAMEDGYIGVWSVPRGKASVRVSADGFATAHLHDFDVPFPPGDVYTLTLARAGRVIGRCLHQGQPVEDFEVVVWERGRTSETQEHSFYGRQDGSFELDAVPIGQLFVTASSARNPPCEPRLIDVSEGSTISISLELPLSLTGRGVVTDATTGEPVRDALLQIAAQWQPAGTWGPPQSVAHDGTFELTGLVAGENAVEAWAPGYAKVKVYVSADVNEIADVGQIELQRGQRLTLQLIADSADHDFESWQVSSVDTQRLPVVHFSSDGIARYEDVHAGYLELVLQGDRADGWVRMRPNLFPGEDWSLTHRVSGPKHLTVEVLEGEDATVEDISALLVSYRNADGVTTIHGVALPASGSISLEGIDGGSVSVDAVDSNHRRVASAHGSFDGSAPLTVRVQLGGDPLVTRVVDDQGETLSGVYVAACDPAQPLWSAFGTTDGSGEVLLFGIPDYPISLALSHPRAGHRTDARTAGGPGTEEFVLTSGASLRIRVVDDGVPIAGAQVQLLDEVNDPFRSHHYSDVAGMVEFLALHPGSFRVKARHPECWSTAIEATATLAPSVVDLQLPHLGNLEIVVRDSTGSSRPRVPLELTCLEFEVPVSQWLQAGLISGGPLTSDASGRVALQGLPHGHYRIDAVTPRATPLSETLVVEPGVSTSFEFVID